jgi:thioredoxin reductase (NADPH)
MDEPRLDDADAFLRLDDEVLATIVAAGERRPTVVGDVLTRAGDAASEFFVILRGRVALVDRLGSPSEQSIGTVGEHRFLGELHLVIGQPSFLSAVVREAGEVVALSRAELQALIDADQRVGDVVLRAFLARRHNLIDRGSGLRLIGSHLSPDTRRLREFLTRNRIPHTFLDLETDAEAELLLRGLRIPASETPLVLRGSAAMHNPSNQEIAGELNLRTVGASEHVYDTVVVGAGPAGLGAAVYAASEGLSAVIVDSVAIGGQASTSSRIENYLGFPAGISGSELAERAAVQARRFGARAAVPATALRLSFEDGYHVVELGDDERVRARSVVLATGAAYRRLPVERLTDFEGDGIYYAATEVEAQLCRDHRVLVVGGANSAGQAAVFLARHAARVGLLLRGGDLGAGMSRYLVDQVQADPVIEILLHTEVRTLHGDGSLEAVTVEHTAAGTTRTVDAHALFVFIGADPCTEWLADAVEIDEDGFVLTGQDLTLTHLDPAHDGRERAPFPLETSRPGVFAAGDVRSGSIKRVASAVGEGAMAIRLIHQYLALQQSA